jgi:hypothetical protein
VDYVGLLKVQTPADLSLDRDSAQLPDLICITPVSSLRGNEGAIAAALPSVTALPPITTVDPPLAV